MEERRPAGYWEDFGNVKKELDLIIKKIGRFPACGELQKRGLSGMVRTISKYHGGVNKVREKLGYCIERKPPHYWVDFENVKREMGILIKELGHFPSHKELKDIKKSGLATGIINYHDGLNRIRELMGYKLERKREGYWQNSENLKRELRSIIKELGHFPSQRELQERRLSSITYAIKYHGGSGKVRERMGYKPKLRVSGYWQDFNNVKKELEPLIKELGYLPTCGELQKRGLSSLINGITKYHGGLNRMREKMGYELLRKPMGYLQNFNNLLNELKPIIIEVGHFPHAEEFEKKGLKRLVHAITMFHGGLNEVREKMGYELERKPSNYWKDFKNIERELKLIIKELGHFPSQRELQERRLSSITYAIKYHGGSGKVRERMGCKLLKKPDNYWQNVENMKRELEPVIEEFGHFPTNNELRERGLNGLSYALQRHYGGINKVRELMGYPFNGKIRTEKSLVELLNTDERARKVVSRFGGDIGDVADILAVVYEGRLSREDAANLVAKPSIRAYLGRFKRPIGGIGELAEISNELLPHDRNEVIQGILYRKVSEYIYQKCGPYPSKEKREGLLKEFEEELGKIGGNGNGKEEAQ